MRKARKTRRKKSGDLSEWFQRMDLVYRGALEVIKRHGIVDTPDEIRVIHKRTATRGGRIAPASPDIVSFASKHSEMRPTALIRLVATHFKDASVAEIRASLPHLNPSTVGIQIGRARK